MKKRFSYLVILFVVAFLFTSCTAGTIIPNSYVSKEDYTNANSGQLNNTLQFSIYTYDKTPSFEKNKFMEKVTDETKELLEIFLSDFEVAIKEYDFSEKYDIKIDEIDYSDYTYIDHGTNNNQKEYFIIYYFDLSSNILYYCYMQY